MSKQRHPIMVYYEGWWRYSFCHQTGTTKGPPPLTQPDREPISILEWRRRRDRSQEYATTLRSSRKGWAPRITDMVGIAFMTAVLLGTIISIGWLVATIFA